MKRVAHFRGRLADRHRARDIGGAVLVLAAGIDQEQFAGRDRAIGPRRDAIMHDGAVGPGARDGRKGNVLEQAGLAAEAFQRLDRIDLGELAAGASRSNQARKRTTAAPSRTCAARAPAISTSFFTAFISAIGIGPVRNRAAAPTDETGERVGGGRLIEAHGAFAAPSATSAWSNSAGARTSAISSSVADVVRRACGRRCRATAGPARNDRERERQRRVGHVRAADIEGPGDRMRIGDHERVGLELLDLGADARELVLGRSRRRSAGRAASTAPSGGADGRSRSRRSDWVDRNQRRAGRAQAFASFSAPSTVCSQGS